MKDATAALKIVNEKARKEKVVKKKEAYEERLRIYRGIGASEEEAREAGKRHLRRMGEEGEDWVEGVGWEDEGDKDVEMGDADADAAGPAGADTNMKDGGIIGRWWVRMLLSNAAAADAGTERRRGIDGWK